MNYLKKTSYNKDLQGFSFGSLTVLKNLGHTKNATYDQWECICSCGNKVKTNSYRLLTNRSKSCGMNHIEWKDLTGRHFGKLTVLKEDHRSKCNEIFWLCQCTCGNFRAVRTFKLLRGIITDCYNCVPHYIYQDRSVPVKKSLFSLYKRRAKKKGLIFSLNYEDFVTIISSDCYYCKSSPSNIRRTNYQYKNVSEFIYNGVDRIDNLQGYSKENCVPCCFFCNSAKATLSLKNFTEWALKLYLNLKNGLKEPIINKDWEGSTKDRYRIGQYKSKAIERGLDFLLTKDRFLSLLNSNCFYCESSFKPSGIDRVDNNKGYTEENSVPCCKICNRAKLTRSLNSFTAWGLNLGKNLITG